MAYMDEKTLANAGFTAVLPERSAYAVVNIAGLEGSGKTHLALSAPKPLLYQSTDFGEEGVIQKFKGHGQILRPSRGDYKLDIPIEYRAFVERQESDEARKQREGRLANFVHEQFYRPFLQDFQTAIKSGVRSVVWDNAVDVWEYTRLSVYGRTATNRDDLKTEANAKFREMVRLANVHKINLVMINHLKPKWESYFDSSGSIKWRQTKDLEMAGYDKSPFLVTCNLWTSFNPPDEWTITVKKARDNSAVVGQSFPSMPWKDLMTVLVPQVDAAAWE